MKNSDRMHQRHPIWCQYSELSALAVYTDLFQGAPAWWFAHRQASHWPYRNSRKNIDGVGRGTGQINCLLDQNDSRRCVWRVWEDWKISRRYDRFRQTALFLPSMYALPMARSGLIKIRQNRRWFCKWIAALGSANSPFRQWAGPFLITVRRLLIYKKYCNIKSPIRVSMNTTSCCLLRSLKSRG